MWGRQSALETPRLQVHANLKHTPRLVHERLRVFVAYHEYDEKARRTRYGIHDYSLFFVFHNSQVIDGLNPGAYGTSHVRHSLCMLFAVRSLT